MLFEHEAMADIGGIEIFPDDAALCVHAESFRVDGPGDANSGEAAVVEEKAVPGTAGIEVTPNDKQRLDGRNP